MKSNLKHIFFLLFIFSCTQNVKSIKNYSDSTEFTFSTKGFALIYDDYLYKEKIVSKKLNNEKPYVLQSNLKPNSLVKIVNPNNLKFVNAKVKGTSKYPLIYKIVITKKMAEELDLDINDPYIEIINIKKNVKFFAKEGSMFEEEKNVAAKAPVTSIDILELSSSTIKKNIVKKKPLYIIEIAEFYYYESALSVKNIFEKDENLVNIKLDKISQNKFKVYAGPYNSFKSMKDTYLSLVKLGFENLNVINSNK